VKNVSVKKTGEPLWETKMPFAQNATRATYEVGNRQFIVIATSGARPYPA
jgi:quinoprotein glucose dehydrogenase